MHEFVLLITSSSVGLTKEFKKYIYLKDKYGKNTKTPIDKFNHAIDAARYGIRMLVGESQITADSVFI